MNQYFSTFITGFADIVREELKEKLPDLKVDLLLDGLIAYRTTAEVDKIKEIRFFNNSFVLFKIYKNLDDRPFGLIVNELKASHEFKDFLKHERDNFKPTFKIIFSEQNEYIHLNQFLVSKLEKTVLETTNSKLDKQKGETELWLLVRREKYAVVGLRITNHGDYEKILEKGELRPELAHLLCVLSEPSAVDIFLDPFAGSGAIPFQRLSFSFKKIVASDKNIDLIKNLREKLSNSDVEVKNWDGLDLKEVQSGSINKIVTDPPWGINVNKGINIGNFYAQLLKEFHRVLAKEGIIVLLVARKIDLEKLLMNRFKLIKKIETLVNGQKATVYKLQK